MATVDTMLSASFQNGMFRNDDAAVDDADQVGQLFNVDDPARPVGHAVIVAADGNEPIIADAALELENGTA